MNRPLALVLLPALLGCGGPSTPLPEGATDLEQPVASSSAARCPFEPAVAARVRATVRLGRRLGNSPRAFSVIGDSISAWDYFLKGFERQNRDGGPLYTLGEGHAALSAVLERYAGSFDRTSYGAKGGWTSLAAQLPRYADAEACQEGERRLSPVECELERHRPAFALVLLGTNDAHSNVPARPTDINPDYNSEAHLRWVIERALERGVVPVLSTLPRTARFADGRSLQPRVNEVNEVVEELAAEYHLPLMPLAQTLEPLPDHGLSSDGIHPSWEWSTLSSDLTQAHVYGFTARNLLALETLEQLSACAPL